MSQRALSIFLALSLLVLPSCEQVTGFFNEPQKQKEKLTKENKKLQQEVALLSQRIAKAEADGIVNKVLVALYDLRHSLEKYALKNATRYPEANNINELQTALKGYLPENFEIEAVYLEKVRSQESGYIMIASVKGQEIVVSNLL